MHTATLGGCARVRRAQPTHKASAVIRYGGKPSGLCDQDKDVTTLATPRSQTTSAGSVYHTAWRKIPSLRHRIQDTRLE